MIAVFQENQTPKQFSKSILQFWLHIIGFQYNITDRDINDYENFRTIISDKILLSDFIEVDFLTKPEAQKKLENFIEIFFPEAIESAEYIDWLDHTIEFLKSASLAGDDDFKMVGSYISTVLVDQIFKLLLTQNTIHSFELKVVANELLHCLSVGLRYSIAAPIISKLYAVTSIQFHVVYLNDMELFENAISVLQKILELNSYECSQLMLGCFSCVLDSELGIPDDLKVKFCEAITQDDIENIFAAIDTHAQLKKEWFHALSLIYM